MTEREQACRKAQSFFDDLWQRADPWELETSDFERERYARLLSTLDQPRYARVLEIGCGAAAFTRLLARRADRVLALDISPKAITRAQARQADCKQVEFRVANIMDYNLKDEGPWDLIVMTQAL